jgi:hypothetical protein
MRVFAKEYDTGGHVIEEAVDDGSVIVSVWDGKREVGERICVYIEATCENNAEGYTKLLNALEELANEIRQRKLQPVTT